jgi:carbon monoxide dehydrogenase subunit G
MEMKGEQLIAASRQQVWDALNDPEALKACIPGCESIEAAGANAYQVLMVAKVGPVSAKFKGKLTLSDVQPPESYSIAFEGQGGAAGFAKGGAKVKLFSENKEQTKLAYDVNANVGGKLAQIGSRLVDAAARKVADDFFARFNARFAAKPDEHHDEHHPEPVARDPDLPAVSDTTLMFFAAGALLVVLASLGSLIA